MVLVLLGSAAVLSRGLSLDTDLLGIFGEGRASDGLLQANAAYEKHFNDELLMFVEAGSADGAFTAAEDLSRVAGASGLFAAVKTKFVGGAQDEWVPFLFARRQALLSPEQVAALSAEDRGASLVDAAVRKVFSPLGFTGTVSTDPLGLFQDFMIRHSAQFKLVPRNGYLVHEGPSGTAVFLRAQLKRGAAGFNGDLVNFYQSVKKDFAARGVQVYMLSSALYSAYGSESSMNEIAVYGTLSFVFVTGLLIWCFSSVIPVLASLVTIGLSVLTGYMAVVLLYASVHVLTILLGISVLGVVTDYCTHFFSKGFDPRLSTSAEAFEKIKGPLFVGFLTNVLTYLCLYFTDLAVLKQLAVFTIAGIFTTMLTVLAIFPFFKFRRLRTGYWGKMAALSAFLQRLGMKRSLTAIGIVLLVGVLVTGRLKFNDDVRLLQAVSPVLKADEEKVMSYLGLKNLPAHYVVQGADSESVLENEEDLTARLRSKGWQAMAVSNFVPSQKQQGLSLQTYSHAGDAFERFYRAIGVKDPKVRAEKLTRASVTPFAVEDLLRVAPEFPLAANWLGAREGGNYSVVTVAANDAPLAELRALETPSARVFSKADDLSRVIRLLRETIVKQFGYVLLLLIAVLCFIWGWRRALFIVLPPVISSAATLMLLQAFDGHLNLFHVLAVILIFCLGMDYSVFFSQSRGSTEATHVGILISFLSTVGSFGVLALSSTHAVASFGATVFAGITLCYLLSPLAAWGET